MNGLSLDRLLFGCSHAWQLFGPTWDEILRIWSVGYACVTPPNQEIL